MGNIYKAGCVQTEPKTNKKKKWEEQKECPISTSSRLVHEPARRETHTSCPVHTSFLQRDSKKPSIKIVLADLSLGSKTKLRTRRIEDDILSLQEDVTEDRETQTGVALDSAEAAGAAGGDRGVVDDGAGHNGVVAVDGHGEVRQLR